MVTARRDSRSVTRNSSFFKPVVKSENEETECPELCVPERSQENPDISEDAECETREYPDVSKGPEREALHTENPSIVIEMPRYPRRIRKKPDSFQS